MTKECHKNRSFLQKFKQIMSFSLKKYKKPTKRHQNSHKKSLTALKEQKNTFDISSFVKRFLNSVQKNTKLKKIHTKIPYMPLLQYTIHGEHDRPRSVFSGFLVHLATLSFQVL